LAAPRICLAFSWFEVEKTRLFQRNVELGQSRAEPAPLVGEDREAGGEAALPLVRERDLRDAPVAFRRA
jgi:hypothetical protein